MDTQQKLLRNYIKLLVEDGEIGAGSYGAGGYYSIVSPSALADVIVGPLRDVFKVAEGESKKLFSTGKMAVKLSLGALANVLPGVNINLGNMLRVRKEEIKRLESEYDKFYESALGSNRDLKAAAFLWNPGLFLLGTAVVKLGKKVGEKVDSAGGETKSIRKSIGSFFSTDEMLDKKRPVDISSGVAMAPLSTMSKNYRSSFEENSKKIFEELKNLKKMDDQTFIKKYASALTDAAKLYKNAEAELEKLKKNNVDSSKADSGDAIKLIENKKQAIVKEGKNAIFDLYIKGMRSQKQEIIKSLSELSAQWNISVEPEKHGQVKAIDKAIEEVEKIRKSG